MKKILLTFCFVLLCVTSGNAQTLEEMFINAPEDLSTYINSDMRAELIKFCDPRKDTCSTVNNGLSGDTWISHISNNLIVFHPCSAYTEEFRLLPNEIATDSVLCLIRTYYGPEPESTVTIYDKKWNKINTIDISELVCNTLTERPDTMDESTYDDLKHKICFKMTKATFSKSEDDKLDLIPSAPFLASEDRNRIKPLFMQTIVKWNGKTFN